MTEDDAADEIATCGKQRSDKQKCVMQNGNEGRVVLIDKMLPTSITQHAAQLGLPHKQHPTTNNETQTTDYDYYKQLHHSIFILSVDSAPTKDPPILESVIFSGNVLFDRILPLISSNRLATAKKTKYLLLMMQLFACVRVIYNMSSCANMVVALS